VLKYLRGKVKLSESADSSMESPNSNFFLSPPGKVTSRRRSGNHGATAEDLGIDPFKAKSSRSLNLSAKQISELDISVLQLASDNSVTCVDISKNLLTSIPDT